MRWYQVENILQELTMLKGKLDKKRPLPSKLVESLRKDFLVKNTYHSNAIEGNTLTIYETKAILEDGVTIGGKSLREHLEAINHKQAIMLAEDIVKQKEIMSERIIKELHAIIMHGIDNSIAGVYRRNNVIISGANHIPPNYLKVPDKMHSLMEWYEKENSLHPIEKAAAFHSKFVNIHPFSDGNGRTSRLLMNIELMKYGYLPINIEKEDRFLYYEVLDVAATKGDYVPFTKLISNYEKKELKRYLSLMEPNKEVDEIDL